MRSQAFRHDNENAASATAAEGGAAPAQHRFSESYQQRRKALIAEYGDRQEGSSASCASPSHFKWRTVAIAAAAALVVVPVSAWAVASNADFFAGAFGSNARESVQAHDEVQEYKDGKPVTVTYPTREYVEADIDAAEELLGPYTSTEETKVAIGDHTLTIQSAVRDKDTMVVGYTLERQGGVTALQWDELTNQGKGAYQPNDAPYFWQFVGGIDESRKAEEIAYWETAPYPDDPVEQKAYELGKLAAEDDLTYNNFAGEATLVDPEKSTSDKLYCYAYIIFTKAPQEGAPITLQVGKRSNEKDRDSSWWGTPCDTEQIVEIPVKDAISARTFSADGVGTLDVSPLSLRFEHSAEGGIVSESTARIKFDKKSDQLWEMSFEEYFAQCNSEVDIDACDKIVVRYKNGSEYTVLDELSDLDNTTYVQGRDSRQSVWMFNRLVNPQEIESITINDVIFT